MLITGVNCAVTVGGGSLNVIAGWNVYPVPASMIVIAPTSLSSGGTLSSTDTIPFSWIWWCCN